jgi:penicillin-binding protein 1C
MALRQNLGRYAIWASSILALLLSLPPLSVEVASWGVSLPAELDPTRIDAGKATRVRDRGGVLLAELRRDGKQYLPVTADDMPEHLVQTLLAAEDKRFFQHSGVDWWAVGRASWQWLVARRVVSGASTLTQQLARSTFARERTLWGKWQEMVVARCIERHLSKPQILEAYVNRIEFGPNVVGVGAAADAYFAKPISGLSLSEAATLTGIPRGPALYDPKRPRSPVKKRRDRILERLAENRPDYAEQVTRALAMPLELQERWVAPGAFHWVRRLANADVANPTAEVRTTLDSTLQRRVEALVLRHAGAMQQFGATSAAVLVADNRSHEVLAYVGSPDYLATAAGGQNDGVVALRQPGSALKPFVYASAMARLGYTNATLLPDVPLEFREAGKVYAPRNYDGQFHGPVRLRAALANSLNVPAVHTASQVGVGRLLGDLRTFGFASLTKAPEHYGVALALGDGEVTLEELVTAYMALPNGGVVNPLRLTVGDDLGSPVTGTTPMIAALIRDVLEDPLARAASFGRHSVLEFDFPVGVKTGTSKGARDNWTLGFSDAVTVGVWVGNFDGTPMTGASGVSGAGPLFHAVMREATGWVVARNAAMPPSTFAAVPSLSKLDVCALSGKLPTEHCKARVTESFIPGTEPNTADDMHVAVSVLNGAIADGCPGAVVQVFERYPPLFETWAREAGRPLVPSQRLVACKTPEAVGTPSGAPIVLFPRNGAEYRFVADEPAARQQLVLKGRSGAGPLTFLVDDAPYRRADAPYEVEWPLSHGEHTLQVVASDGSRSEVVQFRVR